jgi:hypothetical protein
MKADLPEVSLPPTRGTPGSRCEACGADISKLPLGVPAGHGILMFPAWRCDAHQPNSTAGDIAEQAMRQALGGR